LLDFVFESRWGHRSMSLVRFVCSKVEVSASGWSLVQRSFIEYGVSECGFEAWIKRRFCAIRDCCVLEIRKNVFPQPPSLMFMLITLTPPSRQKFLYSHRLNSAHKFSSLTIRTFVFCNSW
jgi:hypothetical protein